MREERKFALKQEHIASLPYSQLEAEQDEEHRRLKKIVQDLNRPTPDDLIGKGLFAVAKENAKKRWKFQGIWDDEWGTTTQWRWKHEEPHDSDIAVDANVKLDMFVGERTQAKTTEEPHRKLVQRCEREASRPFYQFLYQVSAQRDLIQSECRRPSNDSAKNHITSHHVLEGPIHHRVALDAWANTRLASEELHRQRSSDSPPPSPSPDINTIAYNRVRDTWVKRGIWNAKRGVLPGMAWKHEQPLEEMLLEEIGPDPVPSQAEDATNGTEERPCLFRFLGPPATTSSRRGNNNDGAEEQPSFERQRCHDPPTRASQPGSPSMQNTPSNSIEFPSALRRSERLRPKRKLDSSDEATESRNNNAVSLSSRTNIAPKQRRRRGR
ncbi:hypothetical protein LCI18_001665 [Fusarium solani-melongenae]|uniref:Uncharacterized protein n=1 Tax=Fusarium solani subsp. cucurbitae TaxID=2747967 RepID=A0ACD3YPB1_FUSSC|nr:hypothetical protein LCI18_001665 [Fusarium solani-melongenae]